MADYDETQNEHPASEPETPAVAQPVEAPLAPQPQSVGTQPVAVEQRRWQTGRGGAIVLGAAVGAVLLFGSGFAVGHATGGDDHGGRRPMAVRDAGQRGPNGGDQQAPGQRQMPQGSNGQPPYQQGAPNRQPQGQPQPGQEQRPDGQQPDQQPQQEQTRPPGWRQ